MTDLVDASQRAAIKRNFDHTLFVEAGAGTGKTTELVARIVGLVLSGRAQLPQIVAITFTEAAAGELRERVREALGHAVGQGGTSSGLAAAALDSIDDAPIQTIHAFSQRVLQLHPIEAGLPPVISVRDNISAEIAFGARWRDYLGKTLIASDPLTPKIDELLRSSLALGFTVRHLHALTKSMNRQWHRVEEWMARVPGVTDAPRLSSMAELSTHSVSLHGLLAMCNDESDRMAQRLTKSILPWLDQLGVTSERYALLGLLADPPNLNVARCGAKKNWKGSALGAVREAVAMVANLLEATLRPTQEWALQSLSYMAAGFVVETAKGRHATGELEFDDLLVLARNLVRDNPRVRRSLATRFRYLLVDEFQDTDPVQAELVRLLSTERAGGLFTVGDPKQSIYRFRSADVEQYLAMREHNKDALLTLQTNFRSLPNVVTWVNETFEHLLSDDLGGVWHPLAAGRRSEGEHHGNVDGDGKGKGGGGSVALIGSEIGRGARASEIREREAVEIVSQIIEARSAGWAVQRGDVSRPPKYGDMAILMPTRAALPALERALRQAEVPYRIESRSLIWATQEVRDVVAILRAIIDPADEIALVAALRTPSFACGDDDLLAWRQAGGRWDYRKTTDDDIPDESVVGRAMARLHELHQRRQWMSVPQMVSSVIREGNMFELAFARRRQRETWSRLRFIIDTARSWSDEGGDSLHGFVKWMTTRIEYGADALESIVPESDDDAVRLMTIHAAKGLEFPLAFICGLGTVKVNTESVRMLWSSRGDLELRIGPKANGWETAGFGSAEQLEAQREASEQARLLYVAATRARDHLVVSTYFQQGRGAQSLAGRLRAICPSVEQPTRSCVAVSSSSDHGLDRDSRPREISWLLERRERAIRRGSVPAAMSATAVNQRLRGPLDDAALLPSQLARDGVMDQADLAQRLAFGRAVHAVLERTSLDSSIVDSALAMRMAQQEEIPERADDVVTSVKLALTSAPVREAVTSRRWWRETYIASSIGEMVIEGYIDLLYQRPDGSLVVVDYKTDIVINADRAQELSDEYRWQLLTYAAALQQTTHAEIARAALVLIAPGNEEAIVLDIENVEAACDDLQRAVQSFRLPPPSSSISL